MLYKRGVILSKTYFNQMHIKELKSHLYLSLKLVINTHTHPHTPVPFLSNFAGAVLGTEAAVIGGFRFTFV